MKSDGFGHEQPYEGETNDWITPKYIIDSFGGYTYFDLDPCASLTQPWKTAKNQYTVIDDGLIKEWPKGANIFLNPPYGPHTHKWIERLSGHKKGVALIFARTETKLWQDYIFPTMNGILFPRGRIQFAHPDGTTPKSSSGAPSAIIAWGHVNNKKLMSIAEDGLIPGAFFYAPFYTGSLSNLQTTFSL